MMNSIQILMSVLSYKSIIKLYKSREKGSSCRQRMISERGVIQLRVKSQRKRTKSIEIDLEVETKIRSLLNGF